MIGVLVPVFLCVSEVLATRVQANPEQTFCSHLLGEARELLDCSFEDGGDAQLVSCLVVAVAGPQDQQRTDVDVHIRATFQLLDEPGTAPPLCVGLSSARVWLEERNTGRADVDSVHLPGEALPYLNQLQTVSTAEAEFQKGLPVGFVQLDHRCFQQPRSGSCTSRVWVSHAVTEVVVGGGLGQQVPTLGMNFSTLHLALRPRYGDSAVLQTVLHSLPAETQVRDMRLTHGRWVTLTRSHLSRPGLVALDLSWNGMATVEPDAFMNVRSLEDLTLAHNKLPTVPAAISVLWNLKYLDLSYNPIIYQYSAPHATHTGLQCLKLASTSLRTLARIRPWLDSSAEAQGPSLTALDVSRCAIEDITAEDVIVLSLQPSLQFLNLSGNRIQTVAPSLTSPLKSLRVLDLSHNNIVRGPGLQLGVPSLEILDLSWNKLTHPGGIARGSVEYVDLSWNRIARWSEGDLFLSSSGHGSWVRHLNLSHNAIATVSLEMGRTLSALDQVDLGGNPLACMDCRALQLPGLNVTQVLNLGSGDPLECSLPQQGADTVPNSDCTEDPALVFVVVTGTSLALLTLICLGAWACYGGRFEMAYLLHLLHIRRQWKNPTDDQDSDFQYDAFVCYCEEDREWVMSALVPRLEGGAERYRLCLGERDFPAGSVILQNLIHAIRNSRNTIVVLSPAFVNNQLCCWQLEQTSSNLMENQRQSLILLELERLDRRPLPRHIKYLMDTRTYLEWSNTAGLQGQLWKRLEMTLGKGYHSQNHFDMS